MSIPKIKPETMGSIIEEVYIKKEEFGVEDFPSGLETENRELALVLYAFIDAVSDYMGDDNPAKREQFSDIAKISCNLLYKTIQKQMEIDAINYE